MYIDNDFPPGIGRLAQFMRVVSDFETNEVEAAVDGLIALLDARTGDPDREDDGLLEGPGCFALASPYRPDDRRAEYRDAAFALATEDDEENGDEQDGSRGEDDFCLHHFAGFKPGCPVSDPGEYGGDEKDASFPEWRASDGAHRIAFEAGMASALHDEDAEDSDSDRCPAGDDHMVAGAIVDRDRWFRYDAYSGQDAGCEDDAEAKCPPAYMIDQSRDLLVTAANDVRMRS